MIREYLDKHELSDSAPSKTTDETDTVWTAAPFSEDELALLFTHAHGTDLRYVAKWSRWFRWNGMCWKEDEILNVFDCARTICRDASVRFDGGKGTATGKQLSSARTVASVERLTRADPRHAATKDQWRQTGAEYSCWYLGLINYADAPTSTRRLHVEDR